MRPLNNPTILIGAFVTSAAAYIGLGYFTERTNFPQLISLVALLFISYAVIWKYRSSVKSIYIWLTAAIILRALFVFNTPNLSDDYPRFIWDGELISNGISPFKYTPHQFDSIQPIATIPNQDALLQAMNSPNYFSIYPPVLQGIFTASSAISNGNIYANIIVMKLIMLASEIVSLLLIFKILTFLKQLKERWLLYAFNPLIIIELVGNLHFEGVLIPFLLGAIYLYLQNKLHLSAISMALAVCSKLLPLMFLPFILWRLGLKKGVVYCSIVCSLTILMFIPLIDMELLYNLSQSIDLYFQSFEFNAGIYFLARWVGTIITGYNQIGIIGPLLSIIALSIIILLSVKKSTFSFDITSRFLLMLSVYFLLATIVHPWYLTGLLALSITTQYRFPVLWSALIFMSYYTYKDTTYTESMWLVAIEYTAVIGYLIYELKTKRGEALSTSPPRIN
jgi:alpha-1,6-mannosyltransferase